MRKQPKQNIIKLSEDKDEITWIGTMVWESTKYVDTVVPVLNFKRRFVVAFNALFHGFVRVKMNQSLFKKKGLDELRKHKII